MRITITQDFDTPEAASRFLALVAAAATTEPVPATGGAALPPVAAAASEPRVRKPRSDAGKTRGPQNKDAAPAAPVAQAQEAQRAEPVPPPAPATPPQAPAKVDAAPSVSPTTGAQPTHDDARAELQKLHNTKGKGMDACIATIRAFGYNRVVDLPKEKLVDFIANVREQVAAQTKANALAKAAK